MHVTLSLSEQSGSYALLRCPAGSPLPAIAAGPGILTITEAEDETSICLRQDRLPTTIPVGIEVSSGWSCIRVDTLADLDAPGVVLSAVRPISEAGLGIFVTSTYLRDYLLIRTADLALVRALFLQDGHGYHLPGQSAALRLAHPNDSAAMGQLHAQLSRLTYGRDAPDKLLDPDHRAAHWQSVLADITGSVFLAEDATGLTGIAMLSDSQITGHEDAAEVKHLYLAPRSQGTGLGKTLLSICLALAEHQGKPGLVLSAVVGNDHAMGFYTHMGGQQAGQFTDPGPLWRSENQIFRWDLGG